MSELSTARDSRPIRNNERHRLMVATPEIVLALPSRVRGHSPDRTTGVASPGPAGLDSTDS